MVVGRADAVQQRVQDALLLQSQAAEHACPLKVGEGLVRAGGGAGTPLHPHSSLVGILRQDWLPPRVHPSQDLTERDPSQAPVGAGLPGTSAQTWCRARKLTAPRPVPSGTLASHSCCLSDVPSFLSPCPALRLSLSCLLSSLSLVFWPIHEFVFVCRPSPNRL